MAIANGVDTRPVLRGVWMLEKFNPIGQWRDHDPIIRKAGDGDVKTIEGSQPPGFWTAPLFVGIAVRSWNLRFPGDWI